jgi:hypothetical protein
MKIKAGLTMESFCNYFMNPPPNSMEMIEEILTLEDNGPTDKVMYWRFKMPLMSARDVSIHIKVTDQEDGKFFVVETVNRPE